VLLELRDIDADEYHADPCERPSLSSSIAHVLDRQSPAHAYARHPRLGGHAPKSTKTLDRGSLSHALLLGQGKSVHVIHAKDWRTKKAQAERDAAYDVGAVPVLVADMKAAEATAGILRSRFAELGIVLDGRSEAAAFWTERDEHGESVQCRAMIDHIKPGVIYDLKSCRSAQPVVCQRHVDAYGYAIQRAAYVSAIETIDPSAAGRTDFVFVFYELEPPHAVTPVRLSGAFRSLGERRWRRAVETWAHCLRENRWPAYASRIIEIEPPPWALANDTEAQLQRASAQAFDLMSD
jgi:hypothetical protein